MNDTRIDRLYELLPAIYRIRDAEQGEPLKALLRVIAEQVNLVEDDIAGLYENEFIETCEDWVVPYIGDLIGYEPVHEAGEPSTGSSPEAQRRNQILYPRREVANTIRYRRRKGALALLELLANDVAGWPARAVEFYRLLAWSQPINHLHLDRGRTVDVRNSAALDLLDGPFDQSAHTVDIRRINSRRSEGRYNIPSVGVFVWRLKSYPVTQTPAYCVESVGPNVFTFSVLGNDSPLYVNPEREADPTTIAGELNLPVPIRRRLLKQQKAALYGDGKSLQIWLGVSGRKSAKPIPVPAEHIIVADLSDWTYLPKKGKVAVDPVLGRISFPLRSPPKNGVWVSYHYGFGADIGGGEYERPISQQPVYALYRVGKGGEFDSLGDAIKQWRKDAKEDDAPLHSVIEIVDSGVYVEPVNIRFSKNHQSLQLRAANRRRPVIRLLDWQTDKPDALTVIGFRNSRFTLDGILITGRGMQVSGDIRQLTIRHSTLVPGWSLNCNNEPQRPTEPSLEVFSPKACIKIEHCIVGSIEIYPSLADVEENGEAPAIKESTSDTAPCLDNERSVRLDPLRVCISDSIIDATGQDLEAIGAPDCTVAHVCLTIRRATVFGLVQVHAIELAENCIFDGRITVAKRQQGCVRFCHVAPESRTPRRYECQPDLVKSAIAVKLKNDSVTDMALIDAAKQQEADRVRPMYNSLRYGAPAYCQLAACCADEIKSGADDQAEMGVFHDLFQPQRLTNLRVRLDEFLPSRLDVGIILSN
ncbi:hypothetical protein [Methylomicrobium sp. Wu6]|uniref:hypothetical protein n=1 Tax=Methylomicrobium sp. Wu6 TaxID=3107928 RepID=UPI002DD6934B|nr:hypothetical protein [Methylomicrobium sp. Wu6]MEC4748948.1 hypothetical protein [Methylomicrobium sp. Wu6]